MSTSTQESILTDNSKQQGKGPSTGYMMVPCGWVIEGSQASAMSQQGTM